MGSDPNFECRHPEHLTLLPASFAAAAASWGLLVARQPRVFDGLRDESIDGNFSDILALLHLTSRALKIECFVSNVSVR